MFRFRNLNRRDLLRFSLPYLASLAVIGAVVIIGDSFIRNLSSKVMSVFQRDTERTAEILAGMAVDGSAAGLFRALPGQGVGSTVFEPTPELCSLLGLERASVVFGAGGSVPLARDSLEDAAIESGHLVSVRLAQGQQGNTGLIRAVYPVLDASGNVSAYASVTQVEPYSIHWLVTLRYAILVLFAVVLVLVVFPRMLFDISELRRQRELDGFDQPEEATDAGRSSGPEAVDILLWSLQSIDLSADTASVLVSGNGDILYMSTAAQVLFDVSEDDCAGCSFWELPSLGQSGSDVRDRLGDKGLETVLSHSSGDEVRVRLSSFDMTGSGTRLTLLVARELPVSGSGMPYSGKPSRINTLDGSVAVISAMIRGFTHELNNLIGGIIGASSVGERLHDDSSPDRDRYSSIIAEATKASRIIRELRESTTPRTGESGYRIDIRVELSEISEALRGVLPGNTPVVFECRSDAIVEAGGEVLRQLVYSLAIGSGNRAQGPVRFSISADDMNAEEAGELVGDLEGFESDYGYVRVSLSDGTVIPGEIQSKFTDPRTKPGEVQETLGASVATAVQAVQRLGGHVAFTSSQGGTAMHVLFRRVPGVTGERIEAAGGEKSGSGISVLIAEDVALVRDSLREMLLHFGFSAKGASTGDEALEMLAMESFDVLMLDLSMPGMPSLDVARKCREKWPRLAILLTSGYDLGEDLAEEVSDLGIPFVAKPYLPEEVAAKITSAVRVSMGNEKER